MNESLCAGHPPGDAIITVACGGAVISEPVIFKYKPTTEHRQRHLSATAGGTGGRTEKRDLRHCLLVRLQQLDICTAKEIEQIYEVKCG